MNTSLCSRTLSSVWGVQVAGEAAGVGAAALLPSPTCAGEAGDALPAADAAFWGTIGHLYAAARAELMRCEPFLIGVAHAVSAASSGNEQG